ncbi:hypothetical protein [Scatolibacter rhodanostii]|uniref:hypothetical protein n=1 Tax=Scatolibacter rhodanostii TaxID=2014781 RepID=UPI000C084E68|nr:hypothetical protein [Scatolibacter rhodanostii]
MKNDSIESVMGKSLLTKDVYGICFTERESLDCTKDNFFALRKKFLSNARKSVKVNKKLVDLGLESRIKGKLSGHSIFWKKTVGSIATEQSYQVSVGTVLIRRNFDNLIISKMFFDRNHQWIKSEYYDAPDAIIAKVILKPDSLADHVERFNYNPSINGYTKNVLCPVPYKHTIDAAMGRPEVILLTSEGLFSYTLEEDARKRLELSKKNEEDDTRTIFAWTEDTDQVSRAKADFVVSFTALEEYGKIKKLHTQNETKNTKISEEKKSCDNKKDKTETLGTEPEIAEETAGNLKAVQREDSPLNKDKGIHVGQNSSVLDKKVVTEKMQELSLESEHESKPATQSEKPIEKDAFALCEEILTEKEAEKEKTSENEDVASHEVQPTAEEIEILEKADAAVSKRMEEQERPVLSNAAALKEQFWKNPVLRQVLPDELPKYFDLSSLSSWDIPYGLVTPSVGEESGEEDVSPIEQQLAKLVQNVENSLNEKQDKKQMALAETAKKKPESIRETIYRAAVVEGKIAGVSGVKRIAKSAHYEGDMKDGKRHGFGVSYSESGTLSYAGFWENDKKSGLGISFRETDHAVHVANWSENKPDSFVSLFDTKGNLQYSGSVQGGEKDGIGVSYRLEDGSVFVGKWEKGQPTEFGSVFDTKGHLIYTGMWEDGRRNGTGSEFNENGEVIFTGEWREDKHYNGVLYKRPSAREE